MDDWLQTNDDCLWGLRLPEEGLLIMSVSSSLLLFAVGVIVVAGSLELAR